MGFGGVFCEAVRAPYAPVNSGNGPFCSFGGSRFMSLSPDDLYGFAIELRKLAYAMPGGHEDPLIGLSERMARYAQHQASTAQFPPARTAN